FPNSHWFSISCSHATLGHFWKTKLTLRKPQTSRAEVGQWDNAVAESFFSTLKQEFHYRNKFASVDEFVKELLKYRHHYNNDRILTRLGGLTPVYYIKTIINQ
ncbi:MAG: IS3 family transposase, partial [Bacteroidales bacterium]